MATAIMPYLEGSIVKVLVEVAKSPLKREEVGIITDVSEGNDGSHLYAVEPEDSNRFASWAYQHSELELYQAAYVVPLSPSSKIKELPDTTRPPAMPDSALPALAGHAQSPPKKL